MKTNKKMVIISIIGVLAFILAIIGVSYAYFTANVVRAGNNGNYTQTQVQAATLSINYVGDNEINFNRMIPGDTFEKTFTLENTGTANIRYKIVINEITNNFISKQDIKLELFEGTNTTPINTINYFPAEPEPPQTNEAISDTLNISPSDGVKSYRMVLTYLNTGADQTPDMGSSLSGKVFIEEVR